jgi:DNA-binding NarL/FixJ family response regulator
MRILLADDQDRVRYGLRVLLSQQQGWQVVGEAADAKSLLALASISDPDLVLLDWNLPDMRPKAVLFSLHRVCQNLPVIVISGQIEVKSAALEAGAVAFFSKANPPDQLVETIQSVVFIDKNKGDER